MRNRMFVAVGVVLSLFCVSWCAGQPLSGAMFGGHDLHLRSEQMTVYERTSESGTEHILLLEDDFSMVVGTNDFSSEAAVVRLSPIRERAYGRERTEFEAMIYLRGSVEVREGRGSRRVDLGQLVLTKGEALVVRFRVTGEVLVTAGLREEGTIAELEQEPLYQAGQTAMASMRMGPLIAEDALVPGMAGMAAYEEEARKERMTVQRERGWEETDLIGLPQPAPGEDLDPLTVLPEGEQEGAVEPRPQYRYPVRVQGLWEPAPEIVSTPQSDGTTVTTVIGRFYMWQQRNEQGDLLEFQADSAVIFSRGGQFDQTQSSPDNTLAGGSVEAVYLRGNIVMTEGPSTIRCSELYYDFVRRQALAIRAERRSFDDDRGIPVYLRAQELRQVSEHVYRADDVVLTTSEFYIPQVEMDASSVVLTDLTSIASRNVEKMGDSRYEAVLKDATFKLDQMPVFYWPKIRTDLERPDVPLRKLQVSQDDEFGLSFESRWHLAKLLGREEPEGVDSELALDFFGERGAGAGSTIKYRGEDYRGNMLGYLLNNRGEDDLGRTSDRKDLDPGEDIRGRFRWRHRHYLPYDWQASVEVSYASDENFIEWFNESEYDTGKAQETLLHLKRIRDNWGFSLLNKFRLTDHRSVVEELPGVEFHLKGQSFWDDQLTWYSDTQVSRFRDLKGSDSTSTIPEQFHTYIGTRNEIDWPLLLGNIKAVPFVAGSWGFDDQDATAYSTPLDDSAMTSDNCVLLGEYGIRLSTLMWRDFPNVRSRLWDLDGIRHIIKPHAELVFYTPSDKTIDMRDMFNFGVLQRWQTHRGEGENRRTLDWMRLDTNITYMDNPGNDLSGPAFFIWNDPSIPLVTRRSSTGYGILRNSITADYEWRVSDTTSLLADSIFDLQSSSLQQMNVGVSRYIYPDISYYLGSRYLRRTRVNVDGEIEKGSHSVVGAITYRLNHRYTIAFSQEYNIQYGANVENRIALVRRYHRMYYSLSYVRDESRDREAILFSIWPEGVKELALGSRDYSGLVGEALEE